MSSTKRQSSWQEDIARNFSRLFLRSKSQEPQKPGIEESDTSSQVKDDEPDSPCTETGEAGPPQELVLELSKAFHGSEGERERAEVEEEEGEGGALCDAGGSPPRPPSSSPPRSPAAPGPGTPTAPLDAFFRKLGSLFHLSSKAEPGSAELQQAEATAETLTVPDPDPTGMTWAPEGSGEPRDPSGRLLGEADADRPCQEGREPDAERQGGGGRGGESESGELPHMPADPESAGATQTPEEHTQPDLQGPPHLVLNEEAGEDCDVARSGTADDDQRIDEQRRLLALACPPVVTYGTYRGLREVKKMRRRHRVQVDSPIAEGEEVQPSASGAAKPSPPGQRNQTAVPATDGQGAAACPDSERVSYNQKGAWASGRGDGHVVAPTTPGIGSIPVIIPSENSQSQSALPQEQEPDPGSAGGQTTDCRPGAVSAALSLSAAEKDSSDKQKVPAEAGSEARRIPAERSGEITTTTRAAAENVAEDTKAGAERAETLSPRGGPAGSPSKVADAPLGEAGRAPVAPGDAAALSRRHGCQLSQCSISLSDTQEAEGSEGPVPADRVTDAREPFPAVWEPETVLKVDQTGPPEDTGPDEEVLRSESKLMVDNILRSALAALQKMESCEQESGPLPKAREAGSPVLPDLDASTDRCLNPAYRQEERSAEQGEGGSLAVSAEQMQGPNEALTEGNRSTLSSGYESIVGSDTDIRNNPAFSSDLGSLSTPVSILDQRQDEQCSVERKQTLFPPEFPSSYSGDRTACHEDKMDPQLNDNTRSVTPIVDEPCSNDSKGNHMSQTNKSISLIGGSAEIDNKDVIQRSNDVSKTPESVAVIDSAQADQAEGDRSFPVVMSSEARGKTVSKILSLAKDATESNRQNNNLTSSSSQTVSSEQQENFPSDIRKLQTDLETPFKLNNVNNENPSYKQLEGTTSDGKTFHSEIQISDSLQPCKGQHLKQTNEKHVWSPGQPFQNSEEVHLRLGVTNDQTRAGSTGGSEAQQGSSEAGMGSHETICQTEQNGTGDVRELWETTSAGDQSFALVESYLATVVDDESGSGGEEDTARHNEPGGVDVNHGREFVEESERPESRALTSAAALDREDEEQWSAVKAYRCHVLSEEHHSSDALRGAVHDNAPSRISGLGALGKKVHPDLMLNVGRGEPSGPILHRFHEMDFHEVEGGFAIINEEEEADAVFVNDTGTMLSPTTRRSKAYPFSLSPIFEEECGREEASLEDLPDPPVTEEDLRSVEKQASSILSLLQSVSERLQSSAFADPYQDSTEDLSPPLRRPLWGCFNDQEEEDGYAVDKDESPPTRRPDKRGGSPDRPAGTDEAGSFKSADHLEGSKQVACLLLEEDRTPTAVSNPTAVSSTPFYEYLKSARSSLPLLDADDKQPRRQVNLCRNDGSPSTMTLASDTDKISEKASLRPTQVHIYDGVAFSGERHEIHADVEDATGLTFPHGASVRVLRGCWLLFREPGFRGPCVVLEEGEKVLSHTGGLDYPGSSPSAVTIGSVRRVVKDDGAPEILIHRADAPERLGVAVDNLETRGAVCLSSLAVKSGCWVAYSDTGFSGSYAVLEEGGSVTPGPHAAPITCARSLRPLTMGGLKVQRPLDPTIVVYEEPSFGGRSRELGDNTANLGAPQGPRGAASLRVLGGAWVGYSREGYRGRQYLLEEGEYRDCLELGGSDQALLSFRFLQADFTEPSVSLLGGRDSPDAAETDVLDSDVPDLEWARTARGKASIIVRSGVWVAYSGRSFRGRQHVLERGTHPGDLDWGDHSGPPASLRPVRLDLCGSGEPKFLLRAFSQPHYQGNREEYVTEVAGCGSNLPKSFRVIRGSWLLFDEEGCVGNQFVLGEGLYPDLTSCGCAAMSVKSMKPIPYSFSDPSISLFSLESFEGLETVAVTPMDSTNNFFTQSVRVNSGLWVVYEYGHFKGRQMLLHPGEFPAWGDRSGWDTIGSLHPLRQAKVYIQLKSRALGSVLTAEMIKDNMPPAKVALCPARGLDTQHWLFVGGLLKCKASKGCLSVIGGKAFAGARVALWPEHGRAHQKWSLNENGTISSHLNRNLVLDIKGGNGFDKDHLVVNEFTADQITQYWDVEV